MLTIEAQSLDKVFREVDSMSFREAFMNGFKIPTILLYIIGGMFFNAMLSLAMIVFIVSVKIFKSLKKRRI